ncbi:MAG: ATP-binding protein, partial [Gemmatimonadetes bacterium]|nr:ATP-binding protein [Gemmatimonadota bacterium]
PRLTERNPEFAPIVERAARLVCTTSEFDDLAREVGLGSHANGATDPAERARLRAELDGMVAHLYGLTEAEFAHILGTFPLVKPEVGDAALEAYRNLTPRPGDPEILRLIARGESSTVEFKSTARWDVKEGKKNIKMEEIIAKTVAAFLNSAGGTLLIGVADDGTVLGLDADYRTLGKRSNADGFEQWLTQHLGRHVGFALAPLLAVSFHDVDGKQVCRVMVKRSPKPVWVKIEGEEQFFVRTNNSSRALSPREAQEYAGTHWK